MADTDLWGNPAIKRANYFVFHDESIPDKRWLLIGLLFVEDSDKNEVLETLRSWREKENYWGEIHYSELPKSFGGKWGAKARVARSWLKTYEEGLCDKAFFIALAVDRFSPAYEHKRFSKEFHAYNRFTAMTLKAGISWFLGHQNRGKIHINLISDAKNRQTAPDEKMTDNFEEYIPYRAALDSYLARSEGKNYPDVEVKLTVRISDKDDLLQLCDLILGATQAALTGKPNRKTKKELGKMVVRWYKDVKKPRWERKLSLYKKFSVSAFPNKDGNFYHNVPFALEDNRQIKFSF